MTLYRQPLENWLGLSFFNTIKKREKTGTWYHWYHWYLSNSPGMRSWTKPRTRKRKQNVFSHRWRHKYSTLGQHRVLLEIHWLASESFNHVTCDSTFSRLIMIYPIRFQIGRFFVIPICSIKKTYGKNLWISWGMASRDVWDVHEHHKNWWRWRRPGAAEFSLQPCLGRLFKERGIRKDRIQYDNIWYMLYILPETSNIAP